MDQGLTFHKHKLKSDDTFLGYPANKQTDQQDWTHNSPAP